MIQRLRADLCLVKLAPPAVVNHGGIIEAAAFMPPVCYGKVVQAGEKVAAHGVHVGQIVGFDRAAGEPLGDLFPTPHLMIPVTQLAIVVERT
jgi:hypothetical protein